MKNEYRLGLSEVENFAQSLAKQLKGGEVLALIGPLGSGKTTFTQVLGRALGVKGKILSPTFVILQEFPTRLKTQQGQPVILSHADLYRTRGFTETKAVGLPDSWGQPHNITVIEWANKIKPHLPLNTVYIYLRRDQDNLDE